MSYIRVWQFQVKPGLEAEFERVYGPKGDWAQLFQRAVGYQCTELLHDVAAPRRYVTIDRWESESAFAAFKHEFAADYRRMDKACERFTESETDLGNFLNIP
jgi:heme-degrading monooxygenase HmoA